MNDSEYAAAIHDASKRGATISAIKCFVESIRNDEREACALSIEMTTAELLLMAGEMTAQEVRTVKAVLAQLARSMRSRVKGCAK